MISLPKGTKENIVVDVTDRLGSITTLDGTTPTFDVRRKNSDTWILDNQAVTNIGMRAYCLIDTAPSQWKVGIYELFINFSSLPEAPRIGPLEFEVAHGVSADLPPEDVGSPSSPSDRLIYQAKVTLNHAQILTLPSTPVQLLAPTQTPNYSALTDPLPVPIAASLSLARPNGFVGNIYSDVDPTIDLELVWGADFSVVAAIASIDGVSLGQDAGHILYARLVAPASTSDIFTCGILDGDFYRKNDFLDNGLYVAMTNTPAGTNLTGGDAADSLVATVYYTLESFI